MKKIFSIFFILFILSNTTVFAENYIVEKSTKDVAFIINGQKFYAVSWCMNVKEGDAVKFLSGDATGQCTSAEFLNLRTDQPCRVWCKK